MHGKGFMMRGVDSMVNERIVLKKEGDSVMYIPTVAGQNNALPVPFKLKSSNDSVFIFENPAHDFPQRIIYRFVNNDSLVARLESNNEGVERYFELFFRRIK